MERPLAETGRGVLVIVPWALLIASIAGQALFRQAVLGPMELLLLSAVSIFAGALFSDLGRAIIGFFISAVLGVATLYILAVMPSLVGVVTAADGDFLQQLWIGIILRALFPFPFIGFIVASIFGAALGERFL